MLENNIYAIVGDRSKSWQDYNGVKIIIQKLLNESSIGEPDTIISGEAEGVDTIAKEWAIKNMVNYKGYPPNLYKYGSPSAYHVRNQQLVDNADVIIAFWSGKTARSGTLSTINKARASDKPTYIFKITNDGRIELELVNVETNIFKVNEETYCNKCESYIIREEDYYHTRDCL